MDLRHNLFIKIISIMALFFTWMFGGVFDIAYAVRNGLEPGSKGQGSILIGNQQPKKQGTEEKFQKSIVDIEQALTDASTDTNTKKNKLKTKKTEIDSLDIEIKKHFAETEKKLKDDGLPYEILERHHNFVKHYEDNLKELKDNLDAIDKAKTKHDVDREIGKTKEHLEKVKPPKKQRLLDPNKLPHRTAEPVFKEPRTKPEQFKTEDRAQNIDHKQKPIFVASSGPLKGILSQNTDTTTQSYIQIAQANPPTSADLAETIEVKFTPAIQAKAQELGHNPVKIYNWVRNNIEYVPTYGSIQGAGMCLQTKQCNDFDTASLLIALLRVSGIHARYVNGTIELPMEKVKNWVGGFTDGSAALTFIASGGIPLKGITEGGRITSVQMEHAWVEAWIDYFPSRGSRHKNGEGDTWIPLDSSFKEHDFRQGIDFSGTVPFDSTTLVNDLISSATVNEAEGWITGIDGSLVTTAITDYRTRIEANMSQNYQNASVGDVVGTTMIIKHEFPIFMGTLPYKTVVKGSLYQEIPDNLRHKMRFRIESGDFYNETTPLDITYSLPQIAGKKITVSYSPATPGDVAVINSYLPKAHADGTPIQLSELPLSLPAYLIYLKPELRIDGQVVARGSIVTMGVVEKFDMTFTDPVRGNDIVLNTIQAGEYWGIAVGVGRMSSEVMKVTQDRLIRTKTKLAVSDFTGLTNDDILGEMLFYTAMLYNARIDGHATVLARSLGVKAVRLPSETVFMSSLKVATVFDVPVSASAGGLIMDVDRNLRLVKAFDGDNNKKLEFMRYSGINSSVFEHRVPEQLFTRVAAPAEGISTVKALQIANDARMPIYTITKDNIAAVLPQLQLDAAVIADIRNAANTGKEVIASKTNISYHGWVGCGYIITDPTTGNGDYLISGGQNGAYIMITSVGIATANPVVIAVGLAVVLNNSTLLEDFTNFVGIGVTEPKDWCGSEGTERVPDYPFGIDATHACMLHDWCYSTGFTYFGNYPADQETCDRIFGSNIYHDCIRQGGYTIFQCGLVADIYEFAVMWLGNKAFKEARGQ